MRVSWGEWWEGSPWPSSVTICFNKPSWQPIRIRFAPLCGHIIGTAPRIAIAGVAEKFYNADQIDEHLN